jgi:WD40 repeat protein
LRADFYPKLAAYPELAQLVQAQQALVGPLDEDGLREAIEQPALRVGLEFEAGLVDTLLADVSGQPGVLPLLEHALLETWRRRRGSMLTLDAYRESGGVKRALAERADALYAELDPEAQATARRLLLRLTQPGEGTEDTRRRASMRELVTGTSQRDAVEQVIGTLVDARLLTSTSDNHTGETWVDVSHEALIRGWPRLRGWIDDDRAGLRIHRRLTEAAEEWQRLSRDPGALYRGARLAETIEWEQLDQPALNSEERAFLEASRAAEVSEIDSERRRARRLRRLAAGLVVLLLATTAAGVVAIRQSQTAQREARVSLSRALAVQAVANLDNRPELAILLSLEAARIAATVEARNAMVTAGQRTLEVETTLHASDVVIDVAFTPDGRRALAGSDALLRLWDLRRRRPVGPPLRGHTGSVLSVATSPDGGMLASAGSDKTVRLWDLANQESLEDPLRLAEEVQSVEFSPDGRLLASGDWSGEVRWSAVQARPRLQGRLNAGEPVLDVAFHPRRSLLATFDVLNRVRLWDLSRRGGGGARLQGARDTDYAIAGVAFSPDGRTLAATDGPALSLYDVAARRRIGDPYEPTRNRRSTSRSALMAVGWPREASTRPYESGTCGGDAQLGGPCAATPGSSTVWPSVPMAGA